MKRTYPTGKQICGSGDSWARHLRKAGKKRANKGTRKALKAEIASTTSDSHMADIDYVPYLLATPRRIDALVRSGLPVTIVDELARALGISHAEFARALGIPCRTVTGPLCKGGVLPFILSDRVARVWRLWTTACSVFEDVQQVTRWFATATEAGLTPLELAATDAGSLAVTLALERIRRGA